MTRGRCAADAKDSDQQNAGHEAADVGHERDAAAGLRAQPDHAEGADQLEHEPHTDSHPARHLGDHPQHDDADTPVRVQHEIAAHHAGNRARGAQAGDVRIVAEHE